LQAAWCTVQPAGSEHVGWHRDGSSAFDYAKLGYPIPLLQLRASYNVTDQTEEFMGNMMMVPGSHRSPVILPSEVHKAIYATPSPSPQGEGKIRGTRALPSGRLPRHG